MPDDQPSATAGPAPVTPVPSAPSAPVPSAPSARILLPGSGLIGPATSADLQTLDQTQIALCFSLLESDITFDGLAISTDWLDPAQGAGTPQAQRLAQMVDDAINRDYDPRDLATIKIEGLASSRDAVRWLRALRLRSHLRSSTLTQLALLKR